MAEHNSTPGTPFAGSFFLATHHNPSRVPAVMSLIGLSRREVIPPLLPLGEYYSSVILQPNGHTETLHVQGDNLLLRDSTDYERAQLMFYYRDLTALVASLGRELGVLAPA